VVLWTGATTYGGNGDAPPPPSDLPKSKQPIEVTIAASSAVLYLQGREISG